MNDIDKLAKAFKTMTIFCPEDIIAGKLITKDKRKEIFGIVSGGSNTSKIEKFQRQKVIDGTGVPCSKTSIRINLRLNTLVDIRHPNIKDDGFDYSEDFDGVQIIGDRKIYINFKCVVGNGGSQTRTMREVYWFIQGQFNAVISLNNVYFANILDGDEAHKCMSKFKHLTSLDTFQTHKNKIYIGDLKDYFEWFNQIFSDKSNVK